MNACQNSGNDAKSRLSMGKKTDVAWKPEDIGRPLPDSPHACSVALPTWASVIGYEEGDPAILEKLNCGYPRFLIHQTVRELFAEATEEVAQAGEKAIVLSSSAVAQRALRFVELRSKGAARVVSFRGLQALIVPEAQEKLALQYWRYTGEVVSSRQAASVIVSGESKVDREPERLLREALASGRGVDAEEIFIFESGMSGVFTTQRAVTALRPGKKTLQMEFSYVDVMRVQQNFGAGVAYLNLSEGEDWEESLQRIRNGEFAAVYSEMPSNPLLRCVNLGSLAEACQAGNTPLIVDDTIASHRNVDVLPYADIVTTSLTKWVSGKGDVMAGSVTLNPESVFYSDLKSFFDDVTANGRMFHTDATVLLENQQGFIERMDQVNANGEALYDALSEHSAVKNIWYPKGTTPYRYEEVKRPDGGYGGLISITLRSQKKAQKFYDSLKINKGPSLGTEFSLVCPYTLLAHYDELEWAESCGVPSDLIRISVGVESTSDLLDSVISCLD